MQFAGALTVRCLDDLFFQGSYVFSKNVGNAGSAFGGQGGLLFALEALPNVITDRFNSRLDRGILAGSRANRFLFTGIYELPWGKGRRFANRLPAFPNALLGGWDLSTITLLESGPFQTAVTRMPDQLSARVAGASALSHRVNSHSSIWLIIALAGRDGFSATRAKQYACQVVNKITGSRGKKFLPKPHAGHFFGSVTILTFGSRPPPGLCKSRA